MATNGRLARSSSLESSQFITTTSTHITRLPVANTSFPSSVPLSYHYFFCFFFFLSSSSSCGPHVGQSGPSTQSQLEYSSLKHPLPSRNFLHLFRFVSVLWRVFIHRRHTCSRQKMTHMVAVCGYEDELCQSLRSFGFFEAEMVSSDFIVDGRSSLVYGEKDGTKVGRNEMIYT